MDVCTIGNAALWDAPGDDEDDDDDDDSMHVSDRSHDQCQQDHTLFQSPTTTYILATTCILGGCPKTVSVLLKDRPGF